MIRTGAQSSLRSILAIACSQGANRDTNYSIQLTLYFILIEYENSEINSDRFRLSTTLDSPNDLLDGVGRVLRSRWYGGNASDR
jgi:hypothetical protein